ncbi:MAG: trypsin-like peptidase domain-containing protein [Propionibacteriaceae bacterium]|nr:trypsin-like peptidase domain-containing protein [Propionibacteriaceae bacterium]
MSNQPMDPRPTFYGPPEPAPAPAPAMPQAGPIPPQYGPAQPQSGPAQPQHDPSRPQQPGPWATPYGPAPAGAQPNTQTRPNTAYATPQVFAPRPAKRRAGVAGLLAVAVLSAGIGGGAALGVDRLVANPDTTSAVTSSQVVQADANNPDWTAVAAAVSDAVVAIQVSSGQGGGQGSGVILDEEGHIVTNNHVIEGGGSGAQIAVLIKNELFKATVVGTDPSTDLAVIKVDAPPSGLKTVKFADSSKLVVGQPVMAIGNPLGLSDTVTTGIVSALNRPVTTKAATSTVGDSSNGVVVTAAIQTSAAINPGNSGGALLNASGELVGITSSIATLSSGSGGQSGSIGIGFAIGSDQARYIADQLIESGVAKHARLGVSAGDVRDSAQLGAQVSEVVAGSAAADAGIQVGDVITSMDGIDVNSSESLVALVRSARVGQDVTLGVLRDGVQESVTATLGSAEG